MGALYLLAIVGSTFGLYGIARRWSPWTRREVLLPVAAASSMLFLLIDTVGLARGWFATPASGTTLALPGAGPLGRGFPIEEPLLLIGIASLLVLVADLGGRGRLICTRALGLSTAVSSAVIGSLVGAVVGALLSGSEYSVVSAALAGAGVAIMAPLIERDRGTRVAVLTFICLMLIFDNLLCAAGIFVYPESPRSGLLIGLLPVEDLLYAVGLAGAALRMRAEVLRGEGSAWRILLASRPISWVNTGLPFLAGIIAAGASERLGGWLLAPLLWWAAGYNLFLYGVNDLYDRASDAMNPRKGGAEGALLRIRDLAPLRVALVAVGLLPALIMAFAIPGPSGVAPLVAVGLAALYSAPWFGRARAIPFADSIVSTSHFVLPPLAGLLFGADFQTVWWPPLIALALWGVASHALGALQDVDADRESDIATIATLLGLRGASRFVVALYLFAASLLLLQSDALTKGAAILPLISAFSVFPLLRGAPTWEVARAAWRRFLWLNAPLGAVASLILLESWR